MFAKCDHWIHELEFFWHISYDQIATFVYIDSFQSEGYELVQAKNSTKSDINV